LQLAERHGVVTREAVLAEGVVGGFSSVYGVFKVLEERGQVRRGYFVNGLGAAQFAVPGAVDRLRALRRSADELDAEPAPLITLSAADPAQPYGASLTWPDTTGRPARIGAALVVTRGGVPLVWHDRRSHHLVTFAAAELDDGWVDALVAQVADGRARSVEIRKINGHDLRDAPEYRWVDAAAKSRGFSDGYRGLALRAR
jgi:ATP-dependent Lhr-like helicase